MHLRMYCCIYSHMYRKGTNRLTKQKSFFIFYLSLFLFFYTLHIFFPISFQYHFGIHIIYFNSIDMCLQYLYNNYNNATIDFNVKLNKYIEIIIVLYIGVRWTPGSLPLLKWTRQYNNAIITIPLSFLVFFCFFFFLIFFCFLFILFVYLSLMV